MMTLLRISLVGLALALVAACSEDTDNSTSSGSTSTTGSTGTTSSSGASGGQGGAGQGGAGQGGAGQGGAGTGGNAMCVSCNDYFTNPANVEITSVCGVQAYDPATGDLTCAPATSCTLLDTLLQCACVDGCPDVDECGSDLCMGLEVSNKCGQCLNQRCSNEQAACAADPGGG